jgi:YD repeat-containing protein
MTSKTDWQGNVTSYTRDSRGLELSRTEANGTPEARTITTEWHSNYRLPVKITEPGKITEYTYDAQGRQLSRTVRNQP